MAKKKKKKKHKKKKKKQMTVPGLTVATADKHQLYEDAVQCPEADCEFFEDSFEAQVGRKPRLLREDFCGTAFLSATWVSRHEENHALGVDLDVPTLDYGREHHIAPLGEAAKRVTIVNDDVRNVIEPKVDILAAMNFSYLVFKTRSDLRGYFEVARKSLVEDGMFILDLYGGPESLIPQEEETVYKRFSYVWDQSSFNPITHEVVNHIHFKFPKGGGVMREAFTYEWRLWTIPELREILEEAGFHGVTVYWEGSDEDGDGNGEFEPATEGDGSESFIVYITARP